jgi:hypothetical protein
MLAVAATCEELDGIEGFRNEASRIKTHELGALVKQRRIDILRGKRRILAVAEAFIFGKTHRGVFMRKRVVQGGRLTSPTVPKKGCLFECSINAAWMRQYSRMSHEL